MTEYSYILNELQLVENELKERKNLILEYEHFKKLAYQRNDKRSASFIAEEQRLIENSIAKDRLYYKQNKLKYKLSKIKEENGNRIQNMDWAIKLFQIVITWIIAITFIILNR